MAVSTKLGHFLGARKQRVMDRESCIVNSVTGQPMSSENSPSPLTHALEAILLTKPSTLPSSWILNFVSTSVERNQKYFFWLDW